MEFLLDTHTLLWAILDDKRLSSTAKRYLSDATNTCFYSPCSLWEITIKHSLGALDIRTTLEDCFSIIIKTGFVELPILREHFIELSKLPQHHKDPFDRLLIAQAISNELKIITKDGLIAKYNVVTIW